MDLKDKVVLVTGGSVGIGRAIVKELVALGAKVSVCDINADLGIELVTTLQKQYKDQGGFSKITFFRCDVTDYIQLEEAFQTTISQLGAIDIVINNAGIMNDRFWELEVDINLNGVIRGTLLAQRFLGKDRGGQGGTVVNVGSNVVVKPYVSVPIYTATKLGIIGFTRAFGDPYHVNLTGLRVLGFCPGATKTELVQDVKKQLLSTEYEKAWKQDTIDSVTQTAEHVAKALIPILQKAPSGSVWLVENGESAREVEFTTKLV